MIYKCPEGHPTVIGFILKNVSKFTAIGHGIFIFHEKIFQNCSFICAHCSPLTALGSHNSNPRARSCTQSASSVESVPQNDHLHKLSNADNRTIHSSAPSA